MNTRVQEIAVAQRALNDELAQIQTACGHRTVKVHHWFDFEKVEVECAHCGRCLFSFVGGPGGAWGRDYTKAEAERSGAFEVQFEDHK